MKRRTKRMGKRKVLIVLDNILIEEMDSLLTEFAPEEKMNRSQLIEEILRYVLEEDDNIILDELFPDEGPVIAKLREFKEKFLSKLKAKRKR